MRHLKILPDAQAHWVTTCEDDNGLSFSETVAFLRRKALQHKRYKDKLRQKTTARLHKVTVDSDDVPEEEMTVEKVAQTIQSILNESESPVAAFNVSCKGHLR